MLLQLPLALACYFWAVLEILSGYFSSSAWAALLSILLTVSASNSARLSLSIDFLSLAFYRQYLHQTLLVSLAPFGLLSSDGKIVASPSYQLQSAFYFSQLSSHYVRHVGCYARDK